MAQRVWCFINLKVPCADIIVAHSMQYDAISNGLGNPKSQLLPSLHRSATQGECERASDSVQRWGRMPATRDDKGLQNQLASIQRNYESLSRIMEVRQNELSRVRRTGVTVEALLQDLPLLASHWIDTVQLLHEYEYLFGGSNHTV